jgi:copper(I)-binding protein
VNRFGLRTSGLVVCALAAMVAVSGCSAGQVSQTATQAPAVNGVNATAGEISLLNIHLRAPQASDYVRPGSDVELLFVASNGSPDSNDKLVSITSDVGTVTLTGDGAVPADGVLVVGAPDGQISALESVETADAAKAQVTLTKPITNGLTYDFTFKFEKAGDTTVTVPVSAGESPRREQTGQTGGESGHSGGH